jgi:hypothetical protein
MLGKPAAESLGWIAFLWRRVNAIVLRQKDLILFPWV